MSLYFKIILVLFGLAYLVSPMDIIPDFLVPYLGWLDDGIIIGTLIYLIRTGKLPNFFFRQKKAASETSTKDNRAKTTNNQSDKSKSKQSKSKHRQNSFSTHKTQSPYETLGIHPGASKNQIKEAYKEAIKKYHPDKLSHLGTEFSDLANEKFVKIQKAYDELMKINRA